MIGFEDLLALREADLGTALRIVGGDEGERRSGTNYGGLDDLDVINTASGISLYLRGDSVVLAYVDGRAWPAAADPSALVDVFGSAGEELPSRQGKLGELHVIADQGIAWSEAMGEIGYVELFPAMEFPAYRREIYREPPTFIQ